MAEVIVSTAETALKNQRIGGLAAPMLGGSLLKRGLAMMHIFLSACLFALIAAVATGLLAFRGIRETLTVRGATT